MQNRKNSLVNSLFGFHWMLTILCFFFALGCSENKTETTEHKAVEKPAAHFENGYSSVNGIRIYFEIYGQGHPLVLLHGGGSTIQSSFALIIPKLAEHFKVVAVELQNHGRSDSRNTPETFTQDADDVFAFLQNRKIEKASFFGFSNGGETLYELSIRHPEIIDNLIIASAPFKKSAFPQGFFEGMKGATLANMPSQLKAEFLKVNADTARLKIMFEQDKQRMINFIGWTDDQIKSITQPTLIINGDKDIMTIEHAIELHHLLSKSLLAILPGVHGEYMGEVTTLSQHKPFFDTCTPLIINFLKSNSNQK